VSYLFQCPRAIPHVKYCADSEAKRLAVEACDRMFGKAFDPCLDSVCVPIADIPSFININNNHGDVKIDVSLFMASPLFA